MSSVLVFDDNPKGVLEWDADEASIVAGGSDASVLVFDRPDSTEIVDAPDGPSGALVLDRVQTDVLIGDPNRVTTVVEGDDHPDYVLVDDDGEEVLVVTPGGVRGAPGPTGPASTVPGPQGDPGDASQYDDMPDLTLIFENHLL